MTASTTTPAAPPVNGAELLSDLAALIRRFVVLPEWAPESLALWILHTHAFHLRETTAYLGIESPEKRCGKTTLLAVLSELVNRPVVAANISPSAFFRVIQETRPTLLIDEADTFLQRNEEVRGILNSGYTRKTSFVVRVSATPQTAAPSNTAAEPAPASSLARFSTWCPKAMACIGRLPDTLADRCILIRIQRKTAAEQCERLRNLQTSDLKDRCLRFIQDNSSAIAAAQPPIPPELNDRAADIWEPLLVLADLAGGDWPQLARQAAQALSAGAQDTNPIGSLLLDLLICFTAKAAPRLHSRTLIEFLTGLSERPWLELSKGRKINEQWLAQRLRPYGIHSRTMWIDDTQAKGYDEEDFKETFRRYIPRSELDALLADARRQCPPAPNA